MTAPIRRILVPTDFSPQAEEAARFAVALAERLGASLTLLHAWYAPMPVPFPDGAAYVPSMAQLKEIERAAQDELKRMKARLNAKVEIATATAEGPPKELLARIAGEQGFDLIVMGTHGRTGFAHLVLGSVAESVVRTAPCPVITVPSKGKHTARASSAPIL